MIALDVGVHQVYESIARERVADVAEALARYRAVNGVYPRELQQLVPEHLAAIPAPKPGPIALNRIWYLRETPALMYVSFPPFGRKVLNVATREWSEID